MTFKDQLMKLKDNWLIIVLVVIVLVIMLGSSSLGRMSSSLGYNEMMTDSLSKSYNSGGGYYPNPGSSDFAPDVKERKIVKTSSLNSEVERGLFTAAEERLKSIVTSSDSFLLSSSSNKYDSGRRNYYQGSYSIKVDTKKYPAVLAQLKDIGEVKYFNENAQDVTGSYTNINIELSAERERLAKYNRMYNDSIAITEKLELTDRIFDQERKVKYLEESLTNMDSRIDYSEIHVSITEKRSDYADVSLARFSSLTESLVSSFNGLLYFLFVVAPWAVVAFVIYLFARMSRKNEEAKQDKKAK